MTTQLRGPDAGTLLVRALRTMGAASDIHIESLAGRPWASATFTGTRYVVRLAARAVPDIRSWLDALPEADFTLRGHLVAELSVDSVALNDGEWRVTLTVLTLEDS
jgi:hypothetical protein